MVERCVELFLRLNAEFELIVVDLSAGRSYAAELAIAVTFAPGYVANQATIEAFEVIAKSLVDEQAWEQL